MTSRLEVSQSDVDLGEVTRQLALAVHDAQVAFDCMGLDDLDRAHTYALFTRSAADAAETMLRRALGLGANTISVS